MVYHVGNVLLMAALAYALLFIALKYGQIQLYPDWWVLVNNVKGDIVVILCVCVVFRNADHEQQFSVVCGHLAYLEQHGTAIFTSVTEARTTKPKKVRHITLRTSDNYIANSFVV